MRASSFDIPDLENYHQIKTLFLFYFCIIYGKIRIYIYEEDKMIFNAKGQMILLQIEKKRSLMIFETDSFSKASKSISNICFSVDQYTRHLSTDFLFERIYFLLFELRYQVIYYKK